MSSSRTTKANRPGPGGRRGYADASAYTDKNVWKSLGRVMTYMLATYKWQFVIVVVCILASAVCTLQMTLFMQTLIDDYILPLVADSSGGFGELATALLKLFAVGVVGALCSFAYNLIMVVISQGTLNRIRVDIFSHMEKLPISYFDTHEHGDIMSVYTNDVDTLRQLISTSIPQVINSLVTVVVTFVSMCRISWQLTILTVLMIVLTMFVSMSVSGRAAVYFTKQQVDVGAVNGYVEEMMEGQKVVKVFNHEDKAREGFRARNEELRESGRMANSLANSLMPMNGGLGNVSYVICAIAGAAIALYGDGTLTLGMIVTFLTLNKNFSQPITQISQQLNNVVMAAAGAARIFELLDEEPEADEGYVTLVNAHLDYETSDVEEVEERTGQWAWKHPHHDGTVTYTPLMGDIVLDGVDFAYVPGKTVLHDVSVYAFPGQKVAFVGSTGAGKTTITNLINRFYDIEGGKIRYDGINIDKIAKPDLRRSLGIVLQDTHLFTGTVMDNIRYGRLDATDEECIEAARLANADGFIRRLPDGYQTKLTGDGAQLSAGQRQLLSIARAAVADPPVLILDEATSSIDTRTEALVQRGMDALMKGRTSFVIAHRLSTVRNADLICVLEAGRVIERGTHDQLIEQRGRYWQLYTGGEVGE